MKTLDIQDPIGVRKPLDIGEPIQFTTTLDIGEPIGKSTDIIPSMDMRSFSDMGKFEKTLDIIGRPGYAIKSLMAQMQKENIAARKEAGDDPEKFNIWLAGKKPEYEKRLESLWKGFSGKERYTANALWNKIGVSGIPLLGFATEVGVDPMMYGGYKMLGKGIRAALKPAVKPLSKIPIPAFISSKTERLRELFVTKSRIPKLNAFIENHLSLRQYYTHKHLQFGIKTRKIIENISNKTKVPVKNVEDRVIKLIELKNYPNEISALVPNIIKEEKLLSHLISHHFDDMLIEEIKVGTGIAGLGSGKQKSILKIRDTLNTIRLRRAKELTTARGHLSRRLDGMMEKKVIRETGKLKGKKLVYEAKGELGRRGEVKALETRKGVLHKEALEKSKVEMRNLISKSNSLDKELSILETDLFKLKRLKQPTARLEQNMAKLNNEYWYIQSEIAERIHTIPELAIDSPFVREISKIDDILKKGIEPKYLEEISKIDTVLKKGVTPKLGITGETLKEKIGLTTKDIGILPHTPIGLPIGKSKTLLKKLTTLRAKRELGYVTRITGSEALQYLRDAKIGSKGVSSARIWNTKIVNEIRRKTGDFTLDEFNNLMASHGIEKLGGKTVEEYFMKQPAYLVATRGMRSAKAVTSAQFFDDVARTFGSNENPGYYIQLPETMSGYTSKIKGKWFDPEVAKEIAKVSKKYINPHEAGAFLRMFDKVQSCWKRWTLAPFPKYHLRNMVGNFWNNYLDDVKPVSYRKAEAVQIWKKLGTNKATLRELKSVGLDVNDARRLSALGERYGVLNRGWWGADIPTTIEKEIKASKGFVAGIKVKGLAEPGMKVGTAIENNARLAHFIDKLDKGHDSLTASQSVKKYLFDYTDLTSFERDVMKRLFPFYTWTRKNIPLQIEMAIMKPEKYMPMTHLLRNRDPVDLLRMKYARPDLYERLPVELRRTSEEVTYVPLEGLLPAGDLTKILHPQEILWELMSPYLGFFIEQKANKSFYFESEIQKYDSETQELLRMDIPVKLKHALTTILPQARLIGAINKIVKKDINKKELTAGEQAFAQTLSSVYKIDPKDLLKSAQFKIVSKMKELEKGMRRARRQGRENEELRIRENYNKVKEELRWMTDIEPRNRTKKDFTFKLSTAIVDKDEEGKSNIINDIKEYNDSVDSKDKIFIDKSELEKQLEIIRSIRQTRRK